MTFIEKVTNTMETERFIEILKKIKNNFKTKNTCALALIMFYEKLNERFKFIVCMILGPTIYSLYNIYVCLEYFFLNILKLSKHNTCFKITMFNY